MTDERLGEIALALIANMEDPPPFWDECSELLLEVHRLRGRLVGMPTLPISSSDERLIDGYLRGRLNDVDTTEPDEFDPIALGM